MIWMNRRFSLKELGVGGTSDVVPIAIAALGGHVSR